MNKDTQIVFLDTETTGVQTDSTENYVISAHASEFEVIGEQKNKIVQLAYIQGVLSGNIVSPDYIADELCDPGIPSCIKAVATTGIVPEMLVGKSSFSELKCVNHLHEINIPDNIIVIHNAPFDLEMLKRDGFLNQMKVIDTLRVIRHLYPNDESHAMQWYRYARKLYLKEPAAVAAIGKDISAHDALGDVIVLKLLFEDLLNKGISIEKMIHLTQEPIFMTKLSFGKYAKKPLIEVATTDADYIFYMLGEEQKKPSEEQNSDLIFTFNKLIKDLELLSNLQMSFGKYKGIKVHLIVRDDLSYINWLLASNEQNIKDGKKGLPAGLLMAINFYMNS